MHRVHHAKCCAGWIISWNQDCWEKYQQPQTCRWQQSNGKKQRSEKNSASASLTTLKSLTVWITTNCEKFLERWDYQSTLPVSWKAYVQIKKQQLELDKRQWAGSKLGKEYIKAAYCLPAYLTYIQSVSCKMPGWMTQNGIKIAGRNINNLRYADDATLMAEI